jgi:hypothetical protein
MLKGGSPTVTNERRFAEDIPRLAAEAFGLAGELCGACRDFHALWPYIRLSRASGAAEGSRAVIEPLLTTHFRQGRRRVLIGGAADTGLLAFVARVGADHGISIKVVDRCDTPLELCRRFARRWSLAIETEQRDLAEFDGNGRFDLIFVHSLLQFIAAARRPMLAERMHSALGPDGRLIMLFRASRRIAGELVSEYREGYVDWILEELERRMVPLPEPRQAFALRLGAYAQAHEAREGETGDPGEVVALLEAAGFDIVSLTPVDPQLSTSFERFGSKLSKQRYVVEAKPR